MTATFAPFFKDPTYRETPAPSSAGSNYSWFTSDFKAYVGASVGSGVVATNTAGADSSLEASLVSYAKAKFSADLNSNAVYVAPWGADANAGTFASPYLTLNKAVRTSIATYVYLMGFTERNPITPNDYRSSDTPTGKLKIVKGLGAPAVIGYPGTDLSAATWTNSSGTYNTVVTAYPGRVLYSGNRDQSGRPIPLLQYGSSGALTGSVYGWYYDSGTATLYVRLGGNSVTASAPLLRAVYSNSSTAAAGDPRFLIYGAARIAFENVIFDGVYPYLLYNSGSGYLFMENCEARYSTNYGVFNSDGYSYLKDVVIHRPKSDGVNYKNPFAPPTGLEWNVTSEFAGDLETFGTQYGNVNASSNDATTGYIVRVNGLYRWSQGPTAPDTNSWNIGVKFGPSSVGFDGAAGVAGGDVVAQVAGKVYCDTCVAQGSRYGYYAYGSGTTIYLRNSVGNTATDGVGVIAQY